MAHPATEAADAPAPTSVSEKAADFENYLFGGEEDDEEQDNEPEGESDEPEGEDDLDLEEADEDEGEPEEAIAAPPSLNAEEKAAFAAASPEAQRAWAASESRRNLQVQEATTKAANAQREAEARAASANAEAQKVFAGQLDQFVAAFEPQQPDPQLAYADPARYIAEKAQYDAAKAQHDTLVQQIRGVRQEADEAQTNAFLQERDRELMMIPEVANPETRDAFLARALSVAAEFGFDADEIRTNATARDIKALARVAELKDKAEKYDKAMSRKMQNVRSAKQRSNRPGAAPHAPSRAAKAKGSWDRVKSAPNKTAQADAMADYLESVGLI